MTRKFGLDRPPLLAPALIRSENLSATQKGTCLNVSIRKPSQSVFSIHLDQIPTISSRTGDADSSGG